MTYRVLFSLGLEDLLVPLRESNFVPEFLWYKVSMQSELDEKILILW